MATQTAVIAGSNVNGNVSSCSVNTSSVNISSFYERTFSVNSCTGQVLQDNTYFDWGYIYIPGTVIVMIIFFFLGVKFIIE